MTEFLRRAWPKRRVGIYDEPGPPGDWDGAGERVEAPPATLRGLLAALEYDEESLRDRRFEEVVEDRVREAAAAFSPELQRVAAQLVALELIACAPCHKMQEPWAGLLLRSDDGLERPAELVMAPVLVGRALPPSLPSFLEARAFQLMGSILDLADAAIGLFGSVPPVVKRLAGGSLLPQLARQGAYVGEAWSEVRRVLWGHEVKEDDDAAI